MNSPVRAMRSIGRDPIFIERAEGAEITDVDGNTYVDYVCSWGPLIHGHAHPAVIEAVTEAAARGTTFGAPTAGEVELAELVSRADARRRHAADDVLGHRGDDERDPARARRHRPREAAQVRRRLPRPRRRAARRGGLGPRHAGHPGVARRAGVGGRRHGGRAVERRATAVRAAFAEHEFAAVMCEPYPANMGLVPPRAASSSCCASWRPSTARCSCSTRSSPASGSPRAARRS